MAQARQLVASALGCEHLSVEKAIAIVEYHARRYDIARRSHRKRRRCRGGVEHAMTIPV
jgi:hypothetical protein